MLVFDIQNKIVEYLFMREKIWIKYLSKGNCEYYKNLVIKKVQKMAQYNIDPNMYNYLIHLPILQHVKKLIFWSNGITVNYWYFLNICNVEELKFISFVPSRTFINKKKLPKLKKLIFENIIPNTDFWLFENENIKEIVFIYCDPYIFDIKLKPVLDKKIKIIIKPSKQIKNFKKKSKNILYLNYDSSQ